MNIYLLEGKYTHYICLADDLLDVESQLKERYKWAKKLSIKLFIAEDTRRPFFVIEWDQYNMNMYADEKKTATFKILLNKELKMEKQIFSNIKDGFF